MGLRETKKAKTRKLISDYACQLFLERGFQNVTVAEIAAKAEVAVTTLFNYFPTKESLLFDREDEIDIDLSETLRHRKKDQSILQAIHRYFLGSQLIDPPNKAVHDQFMRLIRSSPELSAYLRAIWGRYATTLAKEIQLSSNANKLEAETIAKLILEGVNFACHSPAPKEALNLTFKILKNGWSK